MTSTSIRTYLRIKPNSSNPNLSNLTTNSITLKGKTFTVDKILSTTQQSVFTDVAKDQLLLCMRGINSTIFAYGQTGSGKTYTIQGTTHSRGIVPRVFHFLFQATTDVDLRLSLVEIYNESIFDLLNQRHPVDLREDVDSGIFLANLAKIPISSYEQAMALYSQAIRLRTTDETAMNAASSRSHAVLTVWYASAPGVVRKHAKLNIIDLAGSERLRDHYRVAETGCINRSLLCLGAVIKRLGSGGFINYRDSKLTLLLKDSLGGNAGLAVIGTVDLACVAESICTLRFLAEVKMIVNAPTANAEVVGDLEQIKAELARLDDENRELRMKVRLLQRRRPAVRDRCDKVVLKGLMEELQGLSGDFEKLRRAVRGLVDGRVEERLRFYEKLDRVYSDFINKDFKK